jgi:hypothetical protein
MPGQRRGGPLPVRPSVRQMEDGFRTRGQVKSNVCSGNFKKISPETVSLEMGIARQVYVGICVFNGYKETRFGIMRAMDNGQAAVTRLCRSRFVEQCSQSSSVNILFVYNAVLHRSKPMMGPMTKKA